MPEKQKITFVFVHGYSVTNLNTYGELPVRLVNEGKVRNFDIRSEEIHLGRYISFNDEVKLDDISRAFQTAIHDQLPEVFAGKQRFVCITHSTGGPVIRNWWNTYYQKGNVTCPMSHLLMMAPANHGSALAQLGKGKLSRIKAWMEQIEPGQKVLDWLELGSDQAWKLNHDWIRNGARHIKPSESFPFVITGQSIDRKLYDNLNSYTGEAGSDGVVRSAAANLNGNYLRFMQGSEKHTIGKLELVTKKQSVQTAFRIVKGKAHSNHDMGIIASVKKGTNDKKSAELIDVIFDCAGIKDLQGYKNLCDRFKEETEKVQHQEKLETVSRLLGKRHFIHDRYSQVIFKIRDSKGNAVTDFDLLLTAGSRSDPNHLPEGFLVDRQRNKVNNETVTYFFNYDIMIGTGAVKNERGETLRLTSPGAKKLGLRIFPRPAEGFVRYAPCEISASEELLAAILQPNCTTLLEIVLERLVSKEVFRLENLVNGEMPGKREGNFKRVQPGSENTD